GGDGADHLEGGPGDDHLDGRRGTDTAHYGRSPSGVTIDLTLGTASGGSGLDSLALIENARGSSHADEISGDDAANLLEGRGGDDTLAGRGGDDTLWGGPGDDYADGGSGDGDACAAETKVACEV
ncbi:MAG: hypothetical protein ABIJ75_04720, partial [Actinomycetota bacterium]